MSRFPLAGLVAGLLVAGAMALSSCAGAPPAQTPPIAAATTVQAGAPDRVILISIDGFRPDYLGQGQTPVLDGLVAGGAFGPMRPCGGRHCDPTV